MEWQPIETAPRDGAWVLLAGRRQYIGKWLGAWSSGEVDAGYGYRPTLIDDVLTHWMPLPEPPK